MLSKGLHLLFALLARGVVAVGVHTLAEAHKSIHKLPQFLEDAKRFLSQDVGDSKTKVHVVMGNEAGDLDSLVSAIALAALEDALNKEEGRLILPVYNMPRAEVHIYKDNVIALEKAGINPDHLVCRDEVNLVALAASRRLTLTLTDHNELSPRQTFLASSVVAIVDHHEDQGLYMDTVVPENRLVFIVGSACTAAYQRFKEAGAVGDQLLADRALNVLLASAILIDTNNFEEGGAKKPADITAFEALLAHAGETKPWGLDLSAKQWFKNLKAARKDNIGLSFTEIMSKDLKFASVDGQLFAVGSVKSSVLELVAQTSETREVMAINLQEYRNQNGLHSYYGLLKYDGDDNLRGLVLVTSVNCWPELADAFENHLRVGGNYLKVNVKGSRVAWPTAATPALDNMQPAFYTFNSDASRKQILPLVQGFYRGGNAAVCRGMGPAPTPAPAGSAGSWWPYIFLGLIALAFGAAFQWPRSDADAAKGGATPGIELEAR